MTPNNNLSSPATNVYLSEPEDKNKAVVASKNITGPPVYYPPNHELFSSKEEGSGYRAQVRVICHENNSTLTNSIASPGRLCQRQGQLHVRVRKQVEKQE